MQNICFANACPAPGAAKALPNRGDSECLRGDPRPGPRRGLLVLLARWQRWHLLLSFPELFLRTAVYPGSTVEVFTFRQVCARS